MIWCILEVFWSYVESVTLTFDNRNWSLRYMMQAHLHHEFWNFFIILFSRQWQARDRQAGVGGMGFS